MINYNPYDENVLIIGSAGSGKTYFAKFLIKNFLKNLSFVVWDYNWQYGDLKIPISHRLDNIKQLIFQPIDKTEEFFSQFVKFYFKGNRIFVIEETQEYGSYLRMSPEFEKVVRTGRNFGNTYICITQRPAEIHKAIISNAHHIFCFRLTWVRDIELISEWLNADYKTIFNLPRYHFLYKYKFEEKPKVYKPIHI